MHTHVHIHAHSCTHVHIHTHTYTLSIESLDSVLGQPFLSFLDLEKSAFTLYGLHFQYAMACFLDWVGMVKITWLSEWALLRSLDWMSGHVGSLDWISGHRWVTWLNEWAWLGSLESDWVCTVRVIWLNEWDHGYAEDGYLNETVQTTSDFKTHHETLLLLSSVLSCPWEVGGGHDSTWLCLHLAFVSSIFVSWAVFVILA